MILLAGAKIRRVLLQPGLLQAVLQGSIGVQEPHPVNPHLIPIVRQAPQAAGIRMRALV